MGGKRSLQAFLQRFMQLVNVHARQGSNVDEQFTAATNPVWAVATVDGTQIDRGIIDFESRVLPSALQCPLKSQQFTQHRMHANQRVRAQSRIAGMPCPPTDNDRFHHHALMHADRFQPGGFAYDGLPPQLPVLRQQLPGSRHRAFLVGRTEQDQWPLEILRPKLRGGLKDEREEGFHVRAAQAIKSAIAFRCRERVAGPEFRIAGNRVGMSREHEATLDVIGSRGAERRDQIRLPVVDRIDFNAKAQRLGPFGQVVNDAQVALVMTRIGTADRGFPDQGADHLGYRGQAPVHEG